MQMSSVLKLYFKFDKCQECDMVCTNKQDKRKHIFFNHTKFVEIVTNETKKNLDTKIIVRNVPSVPVDKEVEPLLKYYDKDTNQSDEDIREPDIVTDTVDEASSIDKGQSYVSYMKPNGKDLIDSEDISDDEELKNPAYGRQSISRPMRIVAPIPQ